MPLSFADTVSIIDPDNTVREVPLHADGTYYDAVDDIAEGSLGDFDALVNDSFADVIAEQPTRYARVYERGNPYDGRFYVSLLCFSYFLDTHVFGSLVS